MLFSNIILDKSFDNKLNFTIKYMANLIKRKKLPCPECNSQWTYWRVYREHYICRTCGNEFLPYDDNDKKELDGTTNINEKCL